MSDIQDRKRLVKAVVKGVSLDSYCTMLLHLQIESKLTPLPLESSNWPELTVRSGFPVNGWGNSERLSTGMAKRPVWRDRMVEGHFMEKGVYST